MSDVEIDLIVRSSDLSYGVLSREREELIQLVQSISPGWASHFALRWPTDPTEPRWTVLGLTAYEGSKVMLLW